MFFVKYDTNGNVLWAKSAGGNLSDYASSLTTDASNNVYVTGNFTSPTITFGSTTLTNGGTNNQNAFIVKYDASGNAVWAISVGGSNYVVASSITTNTSGYIYLAGILESSTVNFGSTTLTNAGGYDMFIAKLGSSCLAPAITAQPASISVTVGQPATFTVTATGTAPLNYQWKKNTVNISGATNSSYTISSTILADSGHYTCYISNSCGNMTSSIAVLTVSSGCVASTITTQPASTSKNIGQPATFSIIATGTSPLSYQWKKNTVNISGATNSSYTISSTVLGDAGNYTCYVSNGCGNETSIVATLTVNSTTSNITGNVYNISVNFTSGSLDSSATLSAVSVKLYQGTTLISSTTSNSSGFYQFTNVTAGTYHIVASYSGTETVTVEYSNITTPATKNLRIPYSLLTQLRQQATDLKTYTFSDSLFYNLVPVSIDANGYNEICVDDLLTDNLAIQNNYNTIMNTMGRLFIAQKALKEFSNDGALMTAETIVSSWDLGESIFNLFLVSKKIKSITQNSSSTYLINILANKATSKVISIFKNAIIEGCDFIQNDATRVQVKAVMEGVMDMLESKATEGDLSAFNESVIEDLVKSLVVNYTSSRIYSDIFVPQTQYNVDNSCSSASSYSSIGNFDQTYDNVIDNTPNSSFVELGHSKTNSAQTQINNLRATSNIAGTTSSILSTTGLVLAITGIGATLTVVLQSLATLATLTQVGTAGFAISKSVNRIYNIGLELPLATTTSFNSPTYNEYPSQLYASSQLDLLSINLSDAISDYNNKLMEIQNKINSNQRDSAKYKMYELVLLDSLLDVAIMDAVGPIYVSAPFAIDSIAQFDSLFNYTVVNDVGLSMKYRQATYYQLISYVLDSTSTSVNDSVSAYINLAAISNNAMDVTINDMLDTTANIPVPAHVIVQYTVIPPSMAINTSYQIKIHYKNIGADSAVGLYAKIQCTDGFIPLVDLFYLGTINAGAVGDLLIDIQTPAQESVGYFTLIFESPNSTSDGYGEALHTSNYVYNFTGINSQIHIPKSTISIYPNPTSGTFIITTKEKEYSLAIFNVLGEKILSEKVQNEKTEIDLSNQPNGIYFISITTEQGIINKKLIIQK